MGYTVDLDQEEGQGISRELVIAIIFGAFLLFGALIVVAFLVIRGVGQSRDAAAAGPQPSYDVPTAREAYLPAVEAIRTRDPGAQLASGVGAWTPTIDPVYLNAGRTGWTFHFYLPSSQQMATVIVDRGGQARIPEVLAWETPPDLLDDRDWQIDSSQAATLFLQTCRAALDSQPDLQAQMRLSASADLGRLMWQARVVTGENQPVCEVNIDAETGQVR
jgi:hypothetical protein